MDQNMPMKERTKAIKKLLASKFHFTKLSVTRGTGTASGWINVNAEVNSTLYSFDTVRDGSFRDLTNAIEQAIHESGVPLYHYTDDMGNEHSELLVQVRLANA